MKKIAGCLFLLALCLLSACGGEKRIVGKVVETSQGDGGTMTSFVVRTAAGKDMGVLVTAETHMVSFMDGLPVEDFQAGTFGGAMVTAYYEGLRQSFTTQSGESIAAYTARTVFIDGCLTPETATLSDGTLVNIWQTSFGHLYILPDGTELLRVNPLHGPGNGESLDTLNETAQANIVNYYEAQGLLYDVQTELQRVYEDYQKDPAAFSSSFIFQNITPTAVSEQVVYFQTEAHLPLNRDCGYTIRIGAAFDRETGAVIDNAALFTCPPEDLAEALLDVAAFSDPVLRPEMEAAFDPQHILFSSSGLEFYFPRGTLPSQEYSFSFGLDYDETLAPLLQPWAIPTQNE